MFTTSSSNVAGSSSTDAAASAASRTHRLNQAAATTCYPHLYYGHHHQHQGYGNIAQEYSGMYTGHPDPAWHYNLGHLYGRYDDWPTPPHPPPPPHPPSGSSVADPLDPLVGSVLDPSFPSTGQDLKLEGGVQSSSPNSPDFRLFNGRNNEAMDHDSAGLNQSSEASGLASATASTSATPDLNSISNNSEVLSSSATRPQPSRSPYDWMKRSPAFGSSPRTPGGSTSAMGSVPKEGTGRTRTKDKYRVVYSDHQRLELEKEFHYSRYITIRRKSELAQALNLSERQVKIWFQNRRAKERKQMKKRDELIQKEKLDAAASLHAAAAGAAAAAAHAPHMFAMPMLHHGMKGPHGGHL